MSVLRDRLKICGLCLHSCTKPEAAAVFAAGEKGRVKSAAAQKTGGQDSCRVRLPDHRSEKLEKIPPETEDSLFFQFSELYCHMAPVDCEIIGQLLTIERHGECAACELGNAGSPA